ncbi:hypothetical protein SE17_23760, partial [Kouleothrix aurantiaca]
MNKLLFHWRHGGHRLILGFVLLLVALPFAGPAAAQSKSVTVERRNGDATILPNGDVQMVETWQTRFDGGPFRFAFRDIPLNRVEDITSWSVSENGQQYRQASGESPNTFTLDRSSSSQKITWYFPATTDKTRTFTLRYTLKGALRIYDAGDQFFWKFIESDRGYTINQSQVTVHLPQGVTPSQMKVSTYRNTSEESGHARIDEDGTAVFDGRSFGGGTEWEVRVQFPHGVVSAAKPSWQAADDAAIAEAEARKAKQPFYSLIVLVTSMLLGLGGFGGLYLMWYRRGRDLPTGVVAEFYPTPPEDVPAGLVGTLIDERADMKDIIATLVDLARRGYLQISEETKQGFIGSSREFTFVRGNGDLRQLRTYERTLFEKVFGSSRDQRTLDSLRNEFYTTIPTLKKEMYEEVVKQGYFDENPNSVRNRYTLFAVLFLVIAVLAGCFGTSLVALYTPLAPLLGFVLIALAVGFLILSRAMPRKSAQGATAAAKWQAFRRYLERVDKYTNVAEAKDQFERYLPYAVAFGLERSWVQRFEQVNTPAPSWYYPYGYGYGYPHSQTHHGRDTTGTPAGQGGGMPSLDQMAGGAFTGLNAMSSGFFDMLNSTTASFTSAPSSSGSGGSSGGWSGGGGGGRGG